MKQLELYGCMRGRRLAAIGNRSEVEELMTLALFAATPTTKVRPGASSAAAAAW
jgi:hypothetical protein